MFIVRALKVKLRFAPHYYFHKEERKKTRKKRKKKALYQAGWGVLSRFFGKILPDKGGVEIFTKTHRAWPWKNTVGGIEGSPPIFAVLFYFWKINNYPSRFKFRYSKKKISHPKRAAYQENTQATRAEGRTTAQNHQYEKGGNVQNCECRRPTTSQPTYCVIYSKT